MIVAIDFDGVLHRYSEGWKDGQIYDQPVEGSREALQAMKDMGWKIYIFSTRSNKLYHKDHEKAQDQAMKAFLEEHGIPYDRIWNFGKPLADLYIDDRALTFRGDWKSTLEEAQNFNPWNRPPKNPQ
jgi:histidinol phosphatase-like enzyme